MKTLITLTIIFGLIVSAYSQQQLQNASFEHWEDAGTSVEEPVDWSSIKTSDDVYYNNLAPVVWGKSDDAHSGNYSLSLFNVGSLVIATGTISNGRYHTQLPADSSYVFTDLDDERWHTSFTDKPDSVVGWYKANPADGDFATVKFLLHSGYAKIPGPEANYIAMAYLELPSEEVTEWTRFSTPFVYTSNNTPDFCLGILTSGNGVDAMLGSTALFDDLEFVYNGSSVSELPTGSITFIQKNNQLVVNMTNSITEIMNFNVFDLNGKLIYSNIINPNIRNSFDISNINSGLYIAKAYNKSSISTNKIMIVK